ncbi:MAG TPA: ATP-binding protein [Nitrospiria bacterium]
MRFPGIPIRIKILVSLMIVVTSVVGLITYTMVTLFQKDKTVYIVDLTSFVAQNAASETETLLRTYEDQLRSFGKALLNEDLTVDQKTAFVKSLFEDYSDFIAITLKDAIGERATIYDARILEEAGISEERLSEFRAQNPLAVVLLKPEEMIIQNSTVDEKLPSFTMVIRGAPALSPVINDPPPDAVYLSAVIRLNRIMALQGRSRVFETMLVDSEGTLLSHQDPRVVARRTSISDHPVVREFMRSALASEVMEFELEAGDYFGGFARIRSGKLASIAQIPKNVAFMTAQDLINNLLAVALVILLISAMAGLYWSRRLTRPIEKLSRATQEIAQGRFDVSVTVGSRDEIGRLAGSFNHMAGELKAREEALKQAQAALVQSEKMAAFGQLGAGIAHEVKNPLAGILGYTQLAMRKVEPENPVQKHLQVIEKETRRCKTIIENLMKFARQEKAEYATTDITQVLEDAVAIVDHQLSINKVNIEKLFEPVGKVLGNGNQLQQVIMNLMINAQQAMEPDGGKVIVSTRPLPGKIEIRVQDTGPGIPPEIQAKIFEPFFTTKAVGKGTGLGLSVTYGIIKDHKGDIVVDSPPGQGAAFVITLPELESSPAQAPVVDQPSREGILHG